MRILLTGGTGFVGSHLLPSLAQRHEVIAIGRRRPPADVAWIEQDLAQPLDETGLPGGVDAVIHLAQSAHYKEFPDRADDIYAINVDATFRLLDWARRAGTKRFVFASTGGVYKSGVDRLNESDPVSMIDFYVRSKYAAEVMVGGYAGWLRAIILRLFFVYGPGQQRMLIPTLASRVRAGDEVVIKGNPGIRINPLHVSDAVRVFEPALAYDGSGVFNVAGEDTVTLTELVRLLGDIHGREPQIRHEITDPPPGDLIGDNTRIREAFGVVPQTSLRDGLGGVLSALS